ncbi:MAG: 3-oxoacyl-[acyl-carrier-protein] reductase [Clostridia bacterium]
MFNLTNKNAIVTGGSRGIGKVIALTLAKQGANIAVLDMNENEETMAEIAELGVKTAYYKCNVSSLEDADSVVKAVTKEFGSVDILINNAGITRDGLILSMKEADYDAVLDINLKGAFNMIKACYRGFIRKKTGKIVNISSVSGLMGNAGQANYSASKAGLIGLSKSVARELAERGVCCNVVAPGFIATDMTHDLDLDNHPLMNSIPQKKVGTPQDIANAVLFLASDEANYITGEVIRVDGGMAM